MCCVGKGFQNRCHIASLILKVAGYVAICSRVTRTHRHNSHRSCRDRTGSASIRERAQTAATQPNFRTSPPRPPIARTFPLMYATVRKTLPIRSISPTYRTSNAEFKDYVRIEKVLTVGDTCNTLSSIRHSATDLSIDRCVSTERPDIWN
jgi:hypothetical protein